MGKTRDCFKKTGEIKGTFHAKMGSIKDRNGLNLTEAEEVMKWWQEYTELYQKCLNDLDNHNGMVTHLEPDILECEVKWNLGSIVTNKASGGDEIPAELFKTLMLLKCCTIYASKFGNLSSVHRTRKGQFLLQYQRRAMPRNENVQTITWLCLIHILTR